MYSVGSGKLVWPGATQWPMTAGPITSEINSNSLPFQANPGVAVSAIISKQDRIAAILGDEQIGVAVLFEIAGEQCPRMLKLDLVQAGGVGRIFKALRPAIAKQPNLAALFSFTDRGDVNPSVIVIIQSDKTKAPNPVELWQGYPLELASAKVAPQAEPRRREMTEGQIHPAIFVEV